jgi:hypothetical protein
VADFLLRKMPGTPAASVWFMGALLALLLTGCAGEVPVPFLNAALPPAPPGPAPEYPSIAPPVVEGSRIPVMTEAERDAVEFQLKKLVSEREGSVKKKIDKSDQ